MDATQLVQQLKDLGLEPRPYSGRSMYGKECVGVSVDHLGDHELPKGWSHDSLGRGHIVYWRSVAWPES